MLYAKKSQTLSMFVEFVFHDSHEAESIACDHCLLWFHVKCTALKKTPKQKYWFCRKCHKFLFSD